MQCNINRRGRVARLITGLICVVAGIALLWLKQWWIVGGLLVIAGGFQLFEAKQGWCVMRAMGFRTPM